jgi:hypothetical protein
MSHHHGERKITITVPAPLCDLVECYKDSEVAVHVRGIHRELLLTLRSLLDARIESLSEENHKPCEPETPCSEPTAKRVDIK